MVAILCNFESSRLRFTCDTVFRQWLNVPYTLVKDESETPVDSTLISYGTISEKATINLYEEGLLRETDLRKELPEISVRENLPVVFPSDTEEYDFGFDLLSAVFFCLSRYEEHLIRDRDRHGRFESSSSVFKEFVDTPYVDLWIWILEKRLLAHDAISPVKREILWWNSLDVDVAFAYRGRSVFRILGAMAKDFIRFRWSRIFERVAVIAGRKNDPYDTFGLFPKSEAYRNILFWQTGGQTTKDIQLDVKHHASGDVLRRLKKSALIGIHPSYDSPGNREMLREEIQLLSETIGGPIQYSRQHYLRLHFPETYRNLVDEGVKSDFSLGFTDAIGFRAGTAMAFRYFDIPADRCLELEIIPVAAMDSAMKNYLSLSPDQAIRALKELFSSMESTGGHLVTIWHNHSIGNTGEWKGWRRVFEAIPRILSKHG